MHKTQKRALLYLPFLAAFLLWMALYSFSFLQGDDFSFLVQGGTMERIWNNYVYYYTYAGSRMANLFASILLLADLRVWRWITPAVITCLSLLLYYYVAGTCRAEGAPSRREVALACVCAAFPGLMPVARHLFGDTFLWMDGSCNYLYPLLFALAGFVPFYCALRNWRLPKFFRYASPVLFAAACLLHEQIAMLLAAMSVCTLLYRHKKAERSAYLFVLTLVSLAVLVYTLTCPGAYHRMGLANADPTMGTVRKTVVNLLTYLAPLGTDYWPWTSLMGVSALALLWRKGQPLCTGGRALFFYVGFGAVLGPLSNMLRLPAMQEHPLTESPLRNVFEVALAGFWVLYFLAVLLILWRCARSKEAHAGTTNPLRYLPVLYVGMWASQLIPAAIGSVGRPMLHLTVLTLLIALCVLHDLQMRWTPHLQFAAAALAVCMIGNAIHAASANHSAYQRLDAQMDAARRGEIAAVVVDTKQFNPYYSYFNAFGPAYEKELRAYFKLPDSVEMQFKS